MLEVVPRFLITGRRVAGSSFGGVKGRDQVPELVERALAGEIDVAPFVSHRIELDDVNHAPGIQLDELATLGPIFVLKLRFTPEELGRRIVAEMWIYPDGSRVLELSTRAATNEAFQVAAEARAFLGSQGIDLSGEQETKTKKALEFFSERLLDTAIPGTR